MSCTEKNPLVRDGLSQNQRLLKPLEPSYVQVEERDISDFLLFAQRFALKLNYFNNENKVSGNWLPFVRNDITSLIAEIAGKDISDEPEIFANLQRELSQSPDEAHLRKNLDQCIRLAYEIEK